MGSQTTSTAPPIFEAMIVPHRSLSPAALRRLMLALAAMSVLTSIGFWLLGAWPVVGFSGVEIALAILLLRLNAEAVRSSELLLLTEQGLRVVRTDRRGRRQERVLDAGWLNVVLEERPGRVPALLLAQRGHIEEVARQLGETDKRALAAALGAALHRWRNPVFDNPQLR